ncbi:MAG: antibiotic biosynthesis monooxygenase [Dehalococcoidia bacterium]|jgi:heme-degrading monooxygenase HmoA|nr:antibiotic biosynthesis monooxygenase [Dehalococcoidia bacterium]
MITLHVYLVPKAGRAAELQAAIRDPWISTMSEQPGFVQAAMLTPFGDEDSDDIEVVSYWESEELRLEWVARPVHDRVFEPIMELAESVSPTVKTVGHSWNA